MQPCLQTRRSIWEQSDNHDFTSNAHVLHNICMSLIPWIRGSGSGLLRHELTLYCKAILCMFVLCFVCETLFCVNKVIMYICVGSVYKVLLFLFYRFTPKLRAVLLDLESNLMLSKQNI